MGLLQGAIGAVRSIRSEHEIHPAAEVPVRIRTDDAGRRELLAREHVAIRTLAKTAGDLVVEPRGGDRPKGSVMNAAGEIEVLERKLKVQRMAPGVIWFDFDTLCAGNRSQNDYLEIAREYHTLILSRVPKMSAAMASEARRFTWLIDVLYDHRVKLLVSAECQAYDLYVEGRQASEFHRTVSRLIEMRSRDYLAEAHRVD